MRIFRGALAFIFGVIGLTAAACSDVETADVSAAPAGETVEIAQAAPGGGAGAPGGDASGAGDSAAGEATGSVNISAPDASEPFWPQWRGPNGDGTSPATGLPAEWSESKNIVWKVALPAFSGSTPIVWGERIFLTSPEKGDGKPQRQGFRRGNRDPGGDRIVLQCRSRADGSLLWSTTLASGNELKLKQNMSSPSPVTDGERVWTMTGVGELVCVDFDGNEVWRRNLQEDYGKFGLNWGYASSPLLHEDRLIVPVLHGMKTDDPSYVVAIAKATGETIWKTNRPTKAQNESPDAYVTPQLVEVNGRKEVAINGGDAVTGHDFETGEELWRADVLNPSRAGNYRIVGSAVTAGDIVIAPTRREPMTAVRAGGEGSVGGDRVLWTAAGADVPTPVTDGEYVWVVDDRGVVRCYDVETGEEQFEPERIAAGTYSASPVMADGKIYAISESAVTTVVAAKPEFETLATNTLDDPYTLSSPAIAGDSIFIRTSTHLYRIDDDPEG